MKRLCVILVVMLLLVGCGNKDQDIKTPKTDVVAQTEEGDGHEIKAKVTKANGYPFEVNGVTIYMNANAAPIVEALGEPLSFFEAPSCAFQGLDKIYYYSGFELSTYPIGEEDYISSIDFVDDSVTTKEGLYIGASKDEMIQAYGDKYQEEGGMYTYALENSNLTFIIEDDIITAITYIAIVEEE